MWATVYVDENSNVSANYVSGTMVSEMIYSLPFNGTPSYYMNPSFPDVYSLVTTKIASDGVSVKYKDELGFEHEIKTVNDMLGRKMSYDDPDMGLWSYTYYGNGSIKTQTDAKGQTTQFTYNALGRKTQESYADSSYVKYLYTGLNSNGINDGKDHGFDKGRLKHL